MGNMNIYVGNLDLNVTEAELRSVFTRFGYVATVTVKNDQHLGNGQAAGYGYVEMPSVTEGSLAIAGLNGKVLKGRTINSIEAMPMSSEPIRERRRGRWSSH